MPRHHMINNVMVPFTAQEELDWDAREAQVLANKPKRDASAEISRLESTVTPRRLREALAGQPGKDWIASVESAIAIERAKLNG